MRWKKAPALSGESVGELDSRLGDKIRWNLRRSFLRDRRPMQAMSSSRMHSVFEEHDGERPGLAIEL